MRPRTLRRYTRYAVWFHWIHTVLFLVLLVTGAYSLALGSRSAPGIELAKAIHLRAAGLSVAAAVIYTALRPGSVLQFIRDTVSWSADDFRWLLTAPGYYFGGAGGGMPDQGFSNAGQKLWQLVLLGASLAFVATGAVMYFFGDSLPPGVYQWVLNGHDIVFLAVVVMLVVHVYMGTLHPRTRESLRAMWDGQVTEAYARSRHRKWYLAIRDGQDSG